MTRTHTHTHEHTHAHKLLTCQRNKLRNKSTSIPLLPLPLLPTCNAIKWLPTKLYDPKTWPRKLFENFTWNSLSNFCWNIFASDISTFAFAFAFAFVSVSCICWRRRWGSCLPASISFPLFLCVSFPVPARACAFNLIFICIFSHFRWQFAAAAKILCVF